MRTRVLVSAATRAAVGARVTFVDLGTISLKGKAQPVSVFSLASLMRGEGAAATT